MVEGPACDIKNYMDFFVKWRQRTCVDWYVVCLTRGRTDPGRWLSIQRRAATAADGCGLAGVRRRVAASSKATLEMELLASVWEADCSYGKIRERRTRLAGFGDS
jgi:hypothetical protein